MRVSLKKIILIALAFFVPAAYLSWSLAGAEWIWWPVVVLPFVILLLVPILVFSRDRHAKLWWRDSLMHAAHVCMGLLTYIAVFTLLRDLVWLTGLAEFSDYYILGATALALIVGVSTAAFGPRVKRVRLPIQDLPANLEGFCIVQISDLHVSNTIRRRYVERVVRLANACQPQMVALTGDIADGDVDRTREDIEPLSRLEPKGRVYYVIGNHEYYWNAESWLKRFRELGCQTLLNENTPVGETGIVVAGVCDPVSSSMGGPGSNLAQANEGLATAKFKILLAHRPDLAHEADKLGFRIQLSGHTHGGQFFPWTLVIPFVHEFPAGLARAGQMWIYVSVGTGSWGPLLRLGTMPEVTALTLTRAAE